MINLRPHQLSALDSMSASNKGQVIVPTGGGKMVPAKTYKDRKDIGGQRKRAEREQQPTQARGSARLDPRAAQRKAAMERRAAKSSGKTTKIRSQALAKKADALLATKKKQKVDPRYKAQKASGLTAQERKAVTKKGERKLRDLVLSATGKKKESQLKNPITQKEITRRNKKKAQA